MKNTLSTHDIEVMSADELESVSGGNSFVIDKDYFPYGIRVRSLAALQPNPVERLRLELEGISNGRPVEEFLAGGGLVGP